MISCRQGRLEVIYKWDFEIFELLGETLYTQSALAAQHCQELCIKCDISVSATITPTDQENYFRT